MQRDEVMRSAILEPQRLAMFTPQRWPADKDVLQVRFLDGDTEVWRRVMGVATGPESWNSACGLQVAFNQRTPADIRITLARGGSWSYMGNYGMPEPRATMQLGWLEADTPEDELRRVVLHEFGHALGFVHEAQTPWNGIPWNKPAVYAHYAKAGWDKRMVDAQVFDGFAPEVVEGSVYDPTSIMTYSIPVEFVLDPRYAHPPVTRLSSLDRAKAKEWYGAPMATWRNTWFPHIETDWNPAPGEGNA
jgi:hypothetical protein